MRSFKVEVKDDVADVFRAAKAEASEQLNEETQALFVPAPNAIEWCVRREYLNQPILYKYTRSYQVIRDFFELLCPFCNGADDVDCWGKTRAQLEAQVLLRWDPEEQDDVCPGCNTSRSQFMEDGLFQGFNQFNLVCGMRSGKSYSCAYIGTYIEHRLLCAAHTHPGGLAGYYGLSDATQFDGTFLAASQTQSEETVWALFINMRRISPWTRRYAAWVRNESKMQVRTGLRSWTYEETLTIIRNEHPKVHWSIRSLNSNSDTAAGRTRIFSFIDELARMHQTDSVFGVEEIYRTQESSLRTVRSRATLNGSLPWSGPIISVTSTKTRGDYALDLHKRCMNGLISKMYSGLYPTIEFNPFERMENFTGSLQKDPVGTMRDFWCQPPGAEYPLITNEPRFRDLAVDKLAKPKAYFKSKLFHDRTGHQYIRIDASQFDYAFDYPRYLVFDAGLNFDAFTGCCAYGVPLPDGRVATAFDWVFRIVPPKGAEVFFGCVLDIVKEACAATRVVRVEFDQWNSDPLIQQIRNDYGVESVKRTLVHEDFRAFANDAVSGYLKLIPPEPTEYNQQKPHYEWLVEWDQMSPHGAAIRELTELQCDPDTLKVYNPLKGRRRGFNSDDAARVIVHAHTLVRGAGYVKNPGSRSREDARRQLTDGMSHFEPGLANAGVTTGGAGSHFQVDAGHIGSLSRKGGGRGW